MATSSIYQKLETLKMWKAQLKNGGTDNKAKKEKKDNKDNKK